MFQHITFTIIYGIMMFIWSFVYLNKSKDKVNQSFLLLLSVIILWMALSVNSSNNTATDTLSLVVKNLYFLSMMNMSIVFLYFIYRFIKRPPDLYLYIFVALNTIMLFVRYLFAMDYTDPTFWRLSHPIVAPIMSTVFTLPALYALWLFVKVHLSCNSAKQKNQYRIVILGAVAACVISVLSEYLLPAVFFVQTHFVLMYVAILVFVLAIFIAIMKYKFLNIQSDYIFQKLFLHSEDGTVLVNKNLRIITANNVAKKILQNPQLDSGDSIAEFLPQYSFDAAYRQTEMYFDTPSGERRFVSVSQHSLNMESGQTAKLVTLFDITEIKQRYQHERDKLIEQSSIDQLTGLLNKQYLIENYYSQGDGTVSRQLAILFIDVDNFKSINDLYGHLVGDEVLKAAALCIKQALTDQQKVIRFGGDEFLAVFENAPFEELYAAAGRIRAGAAKLDFSDRYPGLVLTFSIGLAEGKVPIEELIMKADRAMYNAKKTGKNKVSIFTPPNSFKPE